MRVGSIEATASCSAAVRFRRVAWFRRSAVAAGRGGAPQVHEHVQCGECALSVPVGGSGTLHRALVVRASRYLRPTVKMTCQVASWARVRRVVGSRCP
jgi:hypothetical protein